MILKHKKEKLDAKLKNASSTEPFNTEMYYKYDELRSDDWYGKYSDRLAFRVQSPVMHFLSTFESYKEWCSK